MNHPVLGPITHRLEYDAHPVGKPPITYNNTYRPAVRPNIQVLGGKTGYNDDARYCLVIATKIDGHTYFMSFLSNEGKLTRFGDVARVADWIVLRHKAVPAGVPAPAKSTTTLVSTHAPARTRAAATPLTAGASRPPTRRSRTSRRPPLGRHPRRSPLLRPRRRHRPHQRHQQPDDAPARLDRSGHRRAADRRGGAHATVARDRGALTRLALEASPLPGVESGWRSGSGDRRIAMGNGIVATEKRRTARRGIVAGLLGMAALAASAGCSSQVSPASPATGTDIDHVGEPGGVVDQHGEAERGRLLDRRRRPDLPRQPERGRRTQRSRRFDVHDARAGLDRARARDAFLHVLLFRRQQQLVVERDADVQRTAEQRLALLRPACFFRARTAARFAATST